MPIKVLIIDDSSLMRKLLTEILRRDPEIEVVGAASDPIFARDLIKQRNPDVLTLDVEMPRMDGLTFLRNLMRLRPMPVVMVSSLTDRGAEATLTALALGAIDFVSKPKLDVAHGLSELGDEIVEKVKAAARIKPLALGDRPVPLPAAGRLLAVERQGSNPRELANQPLELLNPPLEPVDPAAARTSGGSLPQESSPGPQAAVLEGSGPGSDDHGVVSRFACLRGMAARGPGHRSGRLPGDVVAGGHRDRRPHLPGRVGP